MDSMLRAIVLAAGESTRMQSAKALLPDGAGRVFVTRAVHNFDAAGLHDVTIVTGTLHQQIVRAVSLDAPRGTVIRFARNPDPARGQLSSLITGLDAADGAGVEGVLMTLVDVPFASPRTIEAVVDAYRRTRAPIVRPACGARHGHPVLFARVLFRELRRADPAQGAKAVIRARASEIVDVEATDEGAFTDVDTREDYQRAVRW